MEIKSAKYHKDPVSNENVIVVTEFKNGIISHVPMNLGNTDYAEIMRQVEAGDLTIEPADEKN